MNKNGQKILIVDDSRIFMNRLAGLLRESGNIDEIITIENYDEALGCLISHKPDVVFLDIHLRHKSGIDLLKIINLSGLKCKVVMLTNETKKAYRLQCEKLGSAAFMDKSNDFENIPEFIREL